MPLDDKDLEIARLCGKVEALEQQLADVLAKRLGPVAPTECLHLSRDLSGRCPWCTAPAMAWPWTLSDVKLDPACKNVADLGDVWTGMTHFVLPSETTAAHVPSFTIHNPKTTS